MWRFIKSSSNKSNWLDHNFYEICFFGRSNVGKSSLINALATNKKLAKVSKTPGRTQLLNYFQISTKLIAVDLPGYGYARLSKQKKEAMILMIDEYLRESLRLKKVFLLFDSFVGFLKEDIEVLNYLLSLQKEVILIGTKIDKLNQSKAHKLKTNPILLNYKHFLVSTTKKKNIASLQNYINQLI